MEAYYTSCVWLSQLHTQLIPLLVPSQTMRARARRGAVRLPRPRSHDGEVINRGGSYQQAPASSPKKAEGKKRKSPCTPYREKGKGKETRRGFLREPYFARAHAYVRGTLARACAKRRRELLLRRAPCRLRKHPELQIKLLARRRFRRRQKKFSALKIRPKSTKCGFSMLPKHSKS